MTPVRRSSALRREIGETVFRLCTGAGVIAGLLWALEHPATQPKCEPKTTEQVGHCMGTVLSTAFMPYLVGIATGMLLGSLVGAFLGRLIHRPPQIRLATPVPSFAPATPARWIRARYAGRCADCGADIRPGDHILHRPGAARCSSCGQR